MNDEALNLFFKYPEKGRVKTRLASRVGQDFVYRLYCNFIRDIIETAGSIDADTIFTYSATEIIAADNEYWNSNHMTFLQEGAGLGEKMFNSFCRIFNSGYKRCVLIGSDSPDIPDKKINQAFNKLREFDIVLGPSTDGGYYLIGINSDRLDYSIFSDIPWSTGDVLERTIESVGEAGMSYFLLDKWRDIDQLEDLKHYFDQYKDKSRKFHTLNFLINNREELNGKI